MIRTKSYRFHIVLVSILGLLFQSCKDQHGKITNDPPKSTLLEQNYLFPQEELFISFINEIDSAKDLSNGPTLHYLSDDETHLSANVFFDNKKSIKKVIVQEVKRDGSSEICSYYFRGGGLFCWIAEETKVDGESIEFSITKSYLDSAENILYTGSKKHDDIDSLEFMDFKKIEDKVKDKIKVIQLVNQEGPFQTLFRGFSDFNGMKFMVVGTEQYTSTLEIDQLTSGDLKNLLNKPENYMGKKLSISFTTYTKEDNIEYQKLLKVQLLSN